MKPVELRSAKLLVGPLEPQHVAELMRQVSWSSATLDPGRLDEVLQASAGLPFFVLQFAAEAETPAPEIGTFSRFAGKSRRCERRMSIAWSLAGSRRCRPRNALSTRDRRRRSGRPPSLTPP